MGVFTLKLVWKHETYTERFSTGIVQYIRTQQYKKVCVLELTAEISVRLRRIWLSVVAGKNGSASARPHYRTVHYNVTLLRYRYTICTTVQFTLWHTVPVQWSQNTVLLVKKGAKTFFSSEGCTISWPNVGDRSLHYSMTFIRWYLLYTRTIC